MNSALTPTEQERRRAAAMSLAVGATPIAVVVDSTDDIPDLLPQDIDCANNTMAHGMPDAERKWTLKGGIKGMERLVPATRRCKQCCARYASGPSVCPNCGRSYGVGYGYGLVKTGSLTHVGRAA